MIFPEDGSFNAELYFSTLQSPKFSETILEESQMELNPSL